MRSITPKDQQNTASGPSGQDCQEVQGLLPWWANGTLESVERAQVDRHLKECPHCQIELQRTLDAARTLSQHLPTSVLIGRALGDQPSTLDSGLIDDHLNRCASCQAEYQIIAADLVQEEPALASVTSLDEVRQSKRPLAEPDRQPGVRAHRFRRLEWLAAAACLTLAVLWMVPNRSPVEPASEVVDIEASQATNSDMPTAQISRLEFNRPGAVPLMPNGRGVLDGVFLDGFESAEELNWTIVISGHEQPLQSGSESSDIAKQRTPMNEET